MTDTNHVVPADQTGNTYVTPTDRFVVSLLVGYDTAEATTPEQAAALALSLTRDLGSPDTHWYVHDRETGTTHLLDQSAFEHMVDPDSGGYLGHDDEELAHIG